MDRVPKDKLKLFLLCKSTESLEKGIYVEAFPCSCHDLDICLYKSTTEAKGEFMTSSTMELYQKRSS